MTFLRTPANASLPIVGVFMGWISWSPGFPALFFPLAAFTLAWLWGIQRGRLPAFLLFFGYFLAIAKDIPASSQSFLGQGLAIGVVMWIVQAALVAMPFGLMHGERYKPARFAAALILFSVPPLGLLGWASPLLAAGTLFPGLGIAGLVALAALLSITTLASSSLTARGNLLVAPAVLIATLSADIVAASRMPDYSWFAQNTSLGRYPEDPAGHIERQKTLLRLAGESVDGGAKLVLLPEGIAGNWSPILEAIWTPVALRAKEQGATVLIGATTEGADDARMNSLVAIGADSFLMHARIPMPISMWNPWSDEGYSTNLMSPGLARVQGRQVAISICYEDLLVWPLAWSFAAGDPTAILSAGNNWFGDAAATATAIQRTSIELQARLYGVPLIRAVNQARL